LHSYAAANEQRIEDDELRGWLVGVCALLSASAAQAEKSTEIYGTVEGWEIRAALDKSYCSLENWFTNNETGGTEGLLILYDPHREAIVLSWGASAGLDVPPNGYVDLAPYFHKPLGSNRSWLKRTFRHRHSPSDGMNYYIHVFKDPKETRTLLGDFSKYPVFVLYREDQVATAIPLGSSATIAKLRDYTTMLTQNALRQTSK
jgi:hypothetical protein